MEIAVIIEVLNAVLLIALLYAYVQNYREMKTNLGLGLILFAGLLLVQNLLALYFHLMMHDFYSMEAMQHATFLNGAQLIALAILNYVTWKE